MAVWRAGGPATAGAGSVRAAAGALPLDWGSSSPASAVVVVTLKRLLTTARTSIWNSVPGHASDGTVTVSGVVPLRMAVISQRTGSVMPWNTVVSTSPDVGVT